MNDGSFDRLRLMALCRKIVFDLRGKGTFISKYKRLSKYSVALEDFMNFCT